MLRKKYLTSNTILSAVGLSLALLLTGCTQIKVKGLDDDQQITIENDHGMSVRVACYGARVTSIKAPNRKGKRQEIVLGYDTTADYQNAKKKPYWGVTLGRDAARIAGGYCTFDKVRWSPELITHGVRFTYLSPDGEAGYPGNLAVSVTYTLNSSSELKIDYQATTDKATPVNLSNHTYINLAGEGHPTVLAHELMIHADSITVPGSELLPVASTAFDFRNTKPVGRDIESPHELLIKGKGYDHTFVLNKGNPDGLTLAATLYDPESGRFMEVLTEEPAVALYTANALDGSLIGKSGRPYQKHSALCLKALQSPNSPTIILQPGEIYRSQTIYRFSTR